MALKDCILGFFRKSARMIDYSIWFLFSPFKFKKIDNNRIKMVLVVNLSYLGDLLATTPLIKNLSRKFGKVDVAVLPSMKDIFFNSPRIGRLIEFTDSKNFLQKIKSKYDLAVLVWPCSKNMSKTLLDAKIPYRIGCTQTGMREGKGFFLTRKVFPIIGRDIHKVEENLRIGRLVGVSGSSEMEVFPSKNDLRKIQKILKSKRIRNFVVLNPTSKNITIIKNPSHLWPLGRFAEIADYIIEKYNYDVIIPGLDSESILAETIIKRARNKSRIHNFSGKTSKLELAALLSKSKLLVSLDTGTVHLATAVRTRVIDLMGPTSPSLWRPWPDSERNICLFHPEVCNSCRKYTCRLKDNICMKAITVEEVKNTVDRLLK
jgi:ADP-heptose:LPS heptosyltransferase